MSIITKPMLAGKCSDTTKLRYPVICSPKIDGIRALKIDGKILSRSFKSIPNDHIRTTLEAMLPEGADGEIIAGTTFQAVTSAVMGHEGTPAFTFWQFDHVSAAGLSEPYHARLARMANLGCFVGPVRLVPTQTINSDDELMAYEAKCLAEGWEGVMIRDPNGPYKCGRSTEREGWLLKLKRFTDAEAEIIGFEERCHNTNEATINELGHTKRSSAQAGKVPAGTLGNFQVRDCKTGVTFGIGTGEGMTDAFRQMVWNDLPAYLGRLIKYKYQECGSKDAPRLPIFVGFRDPIDL